MAHRLLYQPSPCPPRSSTASPGASVTGYAPDGDSIRFVASDPRALRALRRSELVRLDVDRSVQLRLEGADAPELHYQGVAQPLARAARDTLLRWLGFTHLR